jgi:hypothetical protein
MTSTSELPVSDTIQGKLAPQPGLDPTADDPLVQSRCDFAVDLPLERSWFSAANALTADGRIALALNVLGPSAKCRRVELVSITVGQEMSADQNRARQDAERRSEQMRQFFASRGIAPERIVARTDATAASASCAAKCAAHIAVQVRGVAR